MTQQELSILNDLLEVTFLLSDEEIGVIYSFDEDFRDRTLVAKQVAVLKRLADKHL